MSTGSGELRRLRGALSYGSHTYPVASTSPPFNPKSLYSAIVGCSRAAQLHVVQSIMWRGLRTAGSVGIVARFANIRTVRFETSHGLRDLVQS